MGIYCTPFNLYTDDLFICGRKMNDFGESYDDLVGLLGEEVKSTQGGHGGWSNTSSMSEMQIYIDLRACTTVCIIFWRVLKNE